MVLSLSAVSAGQSAKPQETSPGGGDSPNPAHIARVPENTIIVKGAWSSASDSVTPDPEGSNFANGIFDNPYFGIKYSLPAGWTKSYDGPPPSDTGRYVLGNFQIEDPKDQSHGSVVVTADDLFFTTVPAEDALQFVGYAKDHLQEGYKVEKPPTPVKIGGHPVTFFSYWSPVAELRWYVVATEIRCHAVQISFTSQDTRLLENALHDLDKMTFADGAQGASETPVCIKDYASKGNLLFRVDPAFSEPRGNSMPVRIIIGKDGKVAHIHCLSAFPEQAKAINDALFEWRFKPYLENGKPVEVETGLLFGRAPSRAMPSGAARAKAERR
ncbi:MAG: hypothetical protein J2P13_06250 [Acidobacteria bacterium]|nr:hypothetical protein [Acidobacteriota bacterium]